MADLLQAGGDKAVEAVLAEAKPLDPWQKHSVRQCLESMQNTARSEYPPAVAHLAQLIKAWTGKYSTKHPSEGHRLPRLEPVR